ncbi:MAG: hypothetical protein HZA91_14230 [Verrucomicrobia bacterium]|nr:hypothetical protein [Verrucomicrobiota bacterium]
MRALTDEYRLRCLWFLRGDYYPATPAEALRVLGYIERRGDMAAFRKVAPLKQWLLQNSSGRSAA